MQALCWRGIWGLRFELHAQVNQAQGRLQRAKAPGVFFRLVLYRRRYAHVRAASGVHDVFMFRD
jgi:hypothetical protein